MDDSAYHASCVGLATAVHANTLYKLRSTDGGIRSAQFPVIAGQNRSPAILIECGYLSHPKEDARIATESYRQSLADGIAGGVQNYIRARRKESIVPIRAVAGGAPCPKNIRAIRQIRAS